uniref:Uncharacterized protein n=1 Tax=Lepeophtheirus salmonis TaxID=72036 RepID=A0A0K2VJT9_LEPSM
MRKSTKSLKKKRPSLFFSEMCSLKLIPLFVAKSRCLDV